VGRERLMEAPDGFRYIDIRKIFHDNAAALLGLT
jgi:hypothetical protein